MDEENMDDMMMGEEGMEGMGEEEPLMEEAEAEEPVAEEPKVKNLEDIALEEEGCLCCCCICHCSTEETKDLSCCCCFSLKCGCYTIGVLSIILFSCLFLQVFYKLLNETFDWWYVLVAVILLVPFFIGCCFNIVYFAEDNNASRSKLYVSCILTIISVLTLATWNCFYIVFLYKYPTIQTELGPVVTKKSFVIWSLYIATCIAFLWAYFLCNCRNYYEALMTEEDRADAAEAAKAGGMFAIPKIPGLDDKKMEEEKAAAPASPKEAAPAPAAPMEEM
jgi:hypothetical protein